MQRKLQVLKTRVDSPVLTEVIRQKIGQQVPQDHFHVRGQKPVLLCVDEGLCLLRYPCGATMQDVPVHHLVDPCGSWKTGIIRS